MTTADKLITGALVLAFAAALGALMTWQDRRMDETLSSYRACIADERASGLSWDAARKACIARNR